uniref:Uncharacterized protein n=1 Tax=Anguilla anguilla TaxID=7936 RepID=A0A0E9QKJ6_ANGAN
MYYQQAKIIQGKMCKFNNFSHY